MRLIPRLLLALLLATGLSPAVEQAVAATVTAEVGTADTTTTPNITGAFTPAVNDLLIVVTANTDTANDPLTVTSSISGNTFTKVTDADAQYGGAGTDHSVQIFVANQLIASGEDVSQTVTVDDTGDASSGSLTQVFAVAGMTLTGNTAIRQVSAPDNDSGAGTTPTLVFPGAVLTGNVTIAAAVVNNNPAAITEPSGWTEATEIGYSTPNAGISSVYRNSGFTGTTITYGSTFGGTGAAIAIELSASVVPAFDTGIACSAVDSNSLSCTYDASADAARIFLCAKAKGATAPADGAAIEAGTGCSGTATENTTGSSDSLQIDFSGDPLAEQDIWAVLEEGTSNYSSLSTDLVTRFTAPTGYQFLNKSGAPGGGEVGVLDGASPAAVDGDTIQVSTFADSYLLGAAVHAVTLNADTTFEIAAGGDLSRLIIRRRFSDYSLPAWSDASPVQLAINDLAPIYLGTIDDYYFEVGEVASLQLDAQYVDPENDALSHSAINLPSGLSLSGGETITGTPSACGVYTTPQLTATDTFFEDTVTVVTITVGALVPDGVGLDAAAADAAYEAQCSFVATAGTPEYSGTVPAGNVISQEPEAGEFGGPTQAITYVVSLGACVIPNTVGMDVAAATAAIAAACP